MSNRTVALGVLLLFVVTSEACTGEKCEKKTITSGNCTIEVNECGCLFFPDMKYKATATETHSKKSESEDWSSDKDGVAKNAVTKLCQAEAADHFCYCAADQIEQDEKQKKTVDSCSQYTTAAACSVDPACTWSNGACVSGGPSPGPAPPSPGPAPPSPGNTCASPIGYCGSAYEACCVGFAKKGFPCGCTIKDGNGTAGANCGDCGTGYSACCIGFASGGFPCKCSVA